ncbi:hypothetical protein [Leifsonia sp. A12D58]|uniref:hypothetical protein n=1 Tax=Leifsonia sp. A12D58 TaxID=3397674 RepID=UPI0039E07502
MTLGNDPQPLTRRQLREQARGQEPAQAADSTESVEIVESVESAESVEAVDEPARTHPAPTAHDEEDFVRERTLSRRELRAMLAAQSGIPAEDDGVDDPVDPLGSADQDATAGESADEARTKLNPPIGHWSVDREVDEHVQMVERPAGSFDQLMSRGVGAGGIPTTTNALILPAIPQQGTASGPLTSTGEILITGSIDLPRSLGSTGQHPDHFDSADVDHMLDQLDEGVSTSSVAPVSASKAVSTHTSTRGVMTPPKKSSASVPMILSITAAVLAVGVIALVFAGYLFKIF